MSALKRIQLIYKMRTTVIGGRVLIENTGKTIKIECFQGQPEMEQANCGYKHNETTHVKTPGRSNSKNKTTLERLV